MIDNRHPKLVALDAIKKKYYRYKYREDLYNKFNISEDITIVNGLKLEYM